MRQIERNLLNQQQAFTEDELLFSAKKHRVRNIVRIRINDEIKAVLEQQEKLEKQIVKALKQLREEKRLNRGT